MKIEEKRKEKKKTSRWKGSRRRNHQEVEHHERLYDNGDHAENDEPKILIRVLERIYDYVRNIEDEKTKLSCHGCLHTIERIVVCRK